MLQSLQDLPPFRIEISDPFTRLALPAESHGADKRHTSLSTYTNIHHTVLPYFRHQHRSRLTSFNFTSSSQTATPPRHPSTPTPLRPQPPLRMSFLLRRPSPLTTSLRSTTRAFSSTTPSQLARLTLVGRLGNDPEVSNTAKGGSVIKYAVGTSYGPKDNRQTSWFRVASFAPEGSAQRDYLMGLQKG